MAARPASSSATLMTCLVENQWASSMLPSPTNNRGIATMANSIDPAPRCDEKEVGEVEDGVQMADMRVVCREAGKVSITETTVILHSGHGSAVRGAGIRLLCSNRAIAERY